jgi:hypothetical protein
VFLDKSSDGPYERGPIGHTANGRRKESRSSPLQTVIPNSVKHDAHSSTYTSDRNERFHSVSLRSGNELGQELFPSGNKQLICRGCRFALHGQKGINSKDPRERQAEHSHKRVGHVGILLPGDLVQREEIGVPTRPPSGCDPGVLRAEADANLA